MIDFNILTHRPGRLSCGAMSRNGPLFVSMADPSTVSATNMLKPKLRRPGEAAKVLGISNATVKNWIYNDKLRTVKTLGGHHRVLEEDIERHLRSKLVNETRKKWGLGPGKITKVTNYLDVY